MNKAKRPPIGVSLSADVEYLPDRPSPYRARVRWTDPQTGKRPSLSESCQTEEQAATWIDRMKRAASAGIDPLTVNMNLAEYGDANMTPALRGVEAKTTDPYLAGWRKRVVPTLGHIPVRMITNGAVDRAVHGWIADEQSLSTIKNTLAVLVRVMEQAVRDGIIDLNPARVTGWQHEFRRAEDELDDPRSLALPGWASLQRLADGLVARSSNEYAGWGDGVMFAACTAARIGEVSGCRVKDIDTAEWKWTIRRQTTTAPGWLIDKGTKGKRARTVPIIEEVHELVSRRIAKTDGSPDARLFTGPRGGRITTAVLRDATHWDEVVSKLGYEHLRRHDLRHTGLTWLADAGVKVHDLRKIAGHASLTTTQRYLHTSHQSVTDAGTLLSKHLRRSTDGPQLRAV
ncbi:site-specific integrase [Saccharopolyspora sp. NPDC050642]|uniref:tyrosine-type recombinase/integrase n=1 Tax=Saccharopolyspora sp. NPDC050642 TaxID=3157099 RepID=UPI003402D704